MKKCIFLLIFIILCYDIYDNYTTNYYDYYLIIDNIYYNDTTLNKFSYDINYSIDPSRSEVLNCLYMSRYMGQDWNKKYFYFDNYGNLSDYCNDLIEYVKKELSRNTTDKQLINRNYYKLMNQFVIHERLCINLNGFADKIQCEQIQKLIEIQTNFKLNMCLFNVDNSLCNQYEVVNKTPMMDGYLDKNMREYGRNYYSHTRNYQKIVENNEINYKTLLVSFVGLVGICTLVIYFK